MMRLAGHESRVDLTSHLSQQETGEQRELSAMAYDLTLAQRIRDVFAGDPAVTEKKMFGGVAFLWNGHMFVGVSATSLMARVGKENYEDALRREHVREMDFTGKPMKGYVYVDADAIRVTEDLVFWLRKCESFVKTLPPKSAK